MMKYGVILTLDISIKSFVCFSLLRSYFQNYVQTSNTIGVNGLTLLLLRVAMCPLLYQEEESCGTVRELGCRY